MNLEQQVSSLELAKKLKELGAKQSSYFWWNEMDSPAGGSTFDLADDSNNLTIGYPSYAAFTVAELGEMLPTNCQSYRVRDFPEWYCTFLQQERIEETANTEADARAKMLIYLIENKLITV